MKRLPILMLLVTLALPASRATETLCDSDLQMVGYQVAWAELETDIDNPTSAPQSGGLVLEFVMNGQYYRWWLDGINVPANTEWEVTIGFPATLTMLGMEVCSARPSGITDAPDPVANHVQQKKRKK